MTLRLSVSQIVITSPLVTSRLSNVQIICDSFYSTVSKCVATPLTQREIFVDIFGKITLSTSL